MILLNYFRKHKTDMLTLNIGKGYVLDMNVDFSNDTCEGDIFGDIWKNNEYIISCDDLGLMLYNDISLKELKHEALKLLERAKL